MAGRNQSSHRQAGRAKDRQQSPFSEKRVRWRAEGLTSVGSPLYVKTSPVIFTSTRGMPLPVLKSGAPSSAFLSAPPSAFAASVAFDSSDSPSGVGTLTSAGEVSCHGWSTGVEVI